MKTSNLNFWGVTRYWWVVLVIGLLFILGGFAYLFWPGIGFAVASQLFGWMMVVAGIVSLCVSAGRNRPQGWGWWLICGVINMFVGFMLVRSVVLSEAIFPYFIGLVFAMWGVGKIFNSVATRDRKYWWAYLINGILMLVLSFLVIESGYLSDLFMVSLLTSCAFIYWGLTLSVVSYEMRPLKQ